MGFSEMPDRYDIILSRRSRTPLQVFPAGSVPAFVAGHTWNEVVRVMREPKPMEAVIVPRMSLESVVGGLGSEFERSMHLDIVKSTLILPE